MNRLFELHCPIVFAHRGASLYAPENTLSAFQTALEQGAPAMETDAKLSTDGEVVLIHDQTVNRTTNGKGRVSDFTLVELKELDAGCFFGPQFAGETIPSLREVFEVFGKRLYYNIELTNYRTPWDNLVKKVVELVKEFHYEENVLFSSFYPLELTQAKRLLPEVPLAFIEINKPVTRKLSGWLHQLLPDIIEPTYTYLDEAYVQKQRGWGKRIQVYTVNRPEEIRKMVRLGVDGIISDNPKLCLEIIG